MAFLNEASPDYGIAVEVAPGLRRLVANNPSAFTYHGTNTWLVEEADGLTVIDPGPEDASHTAAILAATGARPITQILLTHTHPDHAGGVAALKAATGATVQGWAKPWWEAFTPDIGLADGDRIGGLTAIHTPGHASDHLCFAWRDGALFSGDHVMSWNTSIVSPPDGDMGAYMDSLRLLLTRDDQVLYCGHGPVLPQPASMIRAMLIHRINRESAVLGALTTTPIGTSAIVAALYADIDPRLHKAAERSVLAHLLKLQMEGRAVAQGDGWLAG